MKKKKVIRLEELKPRKIASEIFWHSSFVHPIFRFGFLVTFGDEVTKIVSVYILQGKMGKTGKNGKENHASKVTKIAKNENMGWTKH